jgi:hypothetical protein
MDVFKRRDFARWQLRENLPDAVLCEAAWEMEAGLFGARLGGLLYKKRIPRPGWGKRGGYRVLLSARIGSRYVFLHGYSKSEQEDITEEEQKVLQINGRVLLELAPEILKKAIAEGVIAEVCCGKQNH